MLVSLQNLLAIRENEHHGSKKVDLTKAPYYFSCNNESDVKLDTWWPFVKDALLFVFVNVFIALVFCIVIPDVNLLLFL